MVTHFTEITVSQWEVISDVFNHQRKRKNDLWVIVNILFFILRSGVQWRNLPKEYPNGRFVYYYFRHWKKDRTIDVLNLYLVHLKLDSATQIKVYIK